MDNSNGLTLDDRIRRVVTCVIRDAPDYRRGVVPAHRVDGRVANAAIRRGYLTKHTAFGKGYSVTDAGRELVMGEPVGHAAVEPFEAVYHHPDLTSGDRAFVDITAGRFYGADEVVLRSGFVKP